MAKQGIEPETFKLAVQDLINWAKITHIFQLSDLTGLTSQLLNGLHKFSELVLARMALLMDQRALLSSFALVGQSIGIWRVVAGKNVHLPSRFHLDWPEAVLLSQPEWKNGKQPPSLACHCNCDKSKLKKQLCELSRKINFWLPLQTKTILKFFLSSSKLWVFIVLNGNSKNVFLINTWLIIFKVTLNFCWPYLSLFLYVVFSHCFSIYDIQDFFFFLFFSFLLTLIHFRDTCT